MILQVHSTATEPGRFHAGDRFRLTPMHAATRSLFINNPTEVSNKVANEVITTKACLRIELRLKYGKMASRSKSHVQIQTCPKKYKGIITVYI